MPFGGREKSSERYTRASHACFRTFLRVSTRALMDLLAIFNTMGVTVYPVVFRDLENAFGLKVDQTRT